jgi:EPS-associated MarR family transcriptional regulator
MNRVGQGGWHRLVRYVPAEAEQQHVSVRTVRTVGDCACAPLVRHVPCVNRSGSYRMAIVHSLNAAPMENISEESRYRLLRYLADHPEASQRDLARELGISLGKANYCLKALIEKGLVKVGNFKNSRNKSAYLYILTPRGIEDKVATTRAFLSRKIAQYDLLAREIDRLTVEVGELK